MASINKLSIRGIRSFSPDDDEQVIEFLFPVTVIVGANGCGKTTIIESLKYAVTGSLPPGKNAGQSFVHDPKALGQSVVKANIKLRFTNRAGKSMVLVRSMELTQAKIKLTFKALDGVLRMTDDAGKRVSMSHKCTEMDRQIPLLLGVSKPILEHVIFCHQEESSWPLQDSAELKKRFDAIFDSTRYTKALKNLDETKKELRNVAKDLKADVAGLASHKHAAKGFRKDLEEQADSLEELEMQIDETKSEIVKTEKELAQFKETMESVEELKADLEEKKSEEETLEQLIQNQERNLTENMTKKHTTRELQDMLRDFDDQVEERQEKQRELERSRVKIQERIESYATESMDLLGDRGRLEAAQDHYQKLLQQRLTKMEEMANQFGIELTISQSQVSPSKSFYDSKNEADSSTQGNASRTAQASTQESILQVSESDMKAFFDSLREREDELKSELKNHRVKTQSLEDQVQDALNDLMARSKSLDNDKGKINAEIREAQKELSNLKTQGGIARVRQTDIEEAKRQAAHFAKERDKANNDPRKSEIPIELRSFEDKIDKLTREIDDDQRVLSDLRMNGESENEISVLKEQVAKEVESLQESVQDSSYEMDRHKLKSPSNELFQNHNEDAKGEDLVIAMETLASAATEKYEEAVSIFETAQQEKVQQERLISEKKALLLHNRKALDSNQRRIEELDQTSVSTYKRIVGAIRKHANSNNNTPNFNDDDPQSVYTYVLERLADMDDLSGDAGKTEVISKVMKRLTKMAKVYDDRGDLLEFRCPCCTAPLEDVETFQRTMRELADPETSPLIKVDPEKLRRDRATKANYDRWRKTISQCMADVGEYQRRVNETKSLQETVADLESRSSELKQELAKNLQPNMEEAQTSVKELRSLVDSFQRWLEQAQRITSKKIRISQKQVDLTMSMTALDTGNRDIRTVERELDEKRDKKDQLNTRMSRLGKEMMQLNTRVANLSAQASRTEQLVKDREAKFAKERQSTLRRTELNEKIHQCQEEEKKIVDQLAALRPKIRVKENEKHKQREHSKDEEERLSSSLSTFTGELSTLRSLDGEVSKAILSNDDQNASLELIAEKLQKLKEKKKEQELRLQDVLQPELDRIQRSIADQESHRTMISGNLELLKYLEKRKSLEADMQRLEEELEAIEGHDVAMQDYAQATKQKSKLLDTKARLEGRRGGFIEQIRHLKRKLQTTEYKNIDDRHRHAMIKHDTTQIAVSDLDKYHKALDRALLRYHGLKIGEINKIIRELWTLTYKGQDISNIEIVSGMESSSRVMASKSYNYRVVMSKAGTQLDMRGRCSAGQRVLASIVIRLALAETFCVNFGCIALDEPTVNLDFHNKKGLAIALSQIIASRANQSNFQLVVITHDEEFVSMMKTELAGQTGFSMPEKYFQVRREEGLDNRFYSRIEAIDWDELL